MDICTERRGEFQYCKSCLNYTGNELCMYDDAQVGESSGRCWYAIIGKRYLAFAVPECEDHGLDDDISKKW